MKKHDLTCIECGKQYKKVEGNFYKNPNNASGYQYKCVECCKRRQKQIEKTRTKRNEYNETLATNFELERLMKRKRILETEIMEMERKQRELTEIKKLIKEIGENENQVTNYKGYKLDQLQ